jgi:hypothetical protein
VLILSRTHEADIVTLKPDHFFGRKLPPWLVCGAVGFDQLPGFNALIKPGAELPPAMRHPSNA